MKAQVSVVLPTYNRARTLQRAVCSVLAQTFKEFELLIVDDCSTDSTAAVVAAIRDPRLRYIRRKGRGGAAAARNAGIAAAQASLIAFQDSDDEWLACKLEKQLQLLATCPPEVGMTYCGLLRWDGHRAQYIPSASNYRLREGDVRLVVPRLNLAPPTAWLVRRECFDRIGLFDEALPALEDWEWLIRLSRQFHVKLLDEPLVVAYESADSLSLNHGVLAQSLTAIIGKHEAQLKNESPSSLAHLYLRAGVRSCLHGDLRAARASLRRAIATCPWDARLWGMWLISLAGTKAVGLAWRVFRRR